MPKFKVHALRVTRQEMLVDAEDEEAAVYIAAGGGGRPLGQPTFFENVEPETWDRPTLAPLTTTRHYG